MELTNLVAHIVDNFVCVEVQNPQEPLHALDRARETEVEAHRHEDLCLEVDQSWLADAFLLVVSEQTDHAQEARRDGLVDFGGDKHGDSGKEAHLVPGEVPVADVRHVPVEDGHGDEERLDLVLLLQVQVEDLLDRVAPVELRDDVQFFLLDKGVLNLLREAHVVADHGREVVLERLVGLGVQVVEHEVAFLLLAQTQVTCLGELSMVLAASLLCLHDAAVDGGNLLGDVGLIDVGKEVRGTQPPLPHQLREVRHGALGGLGLDDMRVLGCQLVHDLVPYTRRNWADSVEVHCSVRHLALTVQLLRRYDGRGGSSVLGLRAGVVRGEQGLAAGLLLSGGHHLVEEVLRLLVGWHRRTLVTALRAIVVHLVEMVRDLGLHDGLGADDHGEVRVALGVQRYHVVSGAEDVVNNAPLVDELCFFGVHFRMGEF